MHVAAELEAKKILTGMQASARAMGYSGNMKCYIV